MDSKKSLKTDEPAAEVGGSELPPARVDNAGSKGKRRRGPSFTELYNAGRAKSRYDDLE